MRLTRRDALATLAGTGIVGGGAAAVLARDGASQDGEEGTAEAVSDPVETLVRAAEVLYPSEVTGVESFVRTYAEGKAAERPDYRAGVREATATLEEYANVWAGAVFTTLTADERETLLYEMGVHTADPDPDGTDPERIRFYVVNDLLYALYASPAGGELVGIENPQGHPGGTESYTRGPEGTDQ